MEDVNISRASVCRVERMTCWLKSSHGNSVAHPCSVREVQGVTRSAKFPDNGPVSGSNKLAGCSESEPIRSLVISKEVADPVDVGGRLLCLS